jgi:hypothetical protein
MSPERYILAGKEKTGKRGSVALQFKENAFRLAPFQTAQCWTLDRPGKASNNYSKHAADQDEDKHGRRLNKLAFQAGGGALSININALFSPQSWKKQIKNHKKPVGQ